MKKLMITFFLLFIFIIPVITFLTPDKNISAIENKILQQLPDLNLDSILSKRFMKSFDKYVSDQFPLRVGFIKIKNIYGYLIGSREFRNVYLSKNNRLLEKFSFNEDLCNSNIKNISKIAIYLKDNYSINSRLMIIPTSIAFYEDQLYEYMITDNQLKALKYIESKFMTLPNSSSFYSPFGILEKNKDKYIYFKTDHHWTQLGAKLAYEDMYKNKIIESPLPVSNDFYGTYYSKAILDLINPDTIFAYESYSNYKLNIDFDYKYNTLYDKSKLKGKNKYQYFLHGDPAIGTIDGNKGVNKEILIFKDSFAHAFMPFLTLNYSKIHFIDPRYYKFDLDNYLSENDNITEVLFMHNISSFNSDILYK
jgi:hypothetical protein